MIKYNAKNGKAKIRLKGNLVELAGETLGLIHEIYDGIKSKGTEQAETDAEKYLFVLTAELAKWHDDSSEKSEPQEDKPDPDENPSDEGENSPK